MLLKRLDWESNMRNISELFDIIKVKPNNVKLYELALTHPSHNADAILSAWSKIDLRSVFT